MDFNSFSLLFVFSSFSDDSLLDFYFRINLKLHAICVTAKIVKIITAPNSSKSPGFNCVVVLKSFEFELPDILADFFNM